MSKTLIGIGLLCIVIGLLWPWLKMFPWGRLPGDISVVRGNFSLFFPLTTSIIISLVFSLLWWLFRK